MYWVPRLISNLGRRRVAVLSLLLGTLLALGSLGPERSLDDWVIGLISQGRSAELGRVRSVFDAFTLSTGDRRDNRELMDRGIVLPWWSDPGLALSFPRPLSALSHRLDERCWPSSGFLMHLHSLLWFVLLLGCVCLIYRRFESSARVAGLAFLLYAVDDAHGAAVGFIADRNALISATFAGAALLAHDRFRRARSASAAPLAALSFACALAGGELATGILGYLVAYAVFLDPGSNRARLWSLAPYFSIYFGFRGLCSHFGYGLSNSARYLSPSTDSAHFVLEAPLKWLMLLQGQFGVIPADYWVFGARARQSAAQICAALSCAFVAWLVAPHLRTAESRFWLAGMLLSLVPLCTVLPHDRLLVLVGIGAMPVISRVLLAQSELWPNPSAFDSHRRRMGAALLAGIHLLAAPLLLPLRAAQARAFSRLEGHSFRTLLSDPRLLQKRWLILSAPNLLQVNYLLPERALLGLSRPRSIQVLSATGSRVRVQRTGDHELTLTPEGGFLETPLERYYRGAPQALSVGSTVQLAAFDAEVVGATADGRPQSVRFAFREPLDQYAFLCWQKDEFETCTLPALQQAFVLPMVDLAPLLFQTALQRTTDGPN